MILKLLIHIIVPKSLLRRNNCRYCLKLRDGLEGRGFEIQQGQEICLFSKTVNTGSEAHPVSLTLNLPTTTIVAQPFLMFC
jgi:hypothetical protein